MIKIVNQDIADGFQWSTSEQTYPFEKNSEGNTLFCKQINLGTLPNTGGIYVNHNISGYSNSKIYKVYGKAYDSSGNLLTIPWPADNGVYAIVQQLTTTQVYIYCGINRSSYTGIVYIIYAK